MKKELCYIGSKWILWRVYETKI